MKIQRIIWAALFASILIYSLVAFMTGQRNAQKPFASELHNEFAIIIYAMSAVTFAAAFFMRARLRKGGSPSRVSNIICWALLESITVYGLVLAMTSADWKLIAPGAALTIAGFILTFPQEE